MASIKPPFLAIALSVFPALSSASGLYLYEMGTDDVGLAAAGNAARAQDASTIATNPAGMTQLQGDVLTLGAQALYGDMHYQLQDQDRKSPSDAIVGWFPGASTFYSHSIDERLKVGLGLYGNFGLSLDFGDWAGGALMQNSTLVGLTLQPTIAYQLNEQWSLGGGINANYGIFSVEGDSSLGSVSIDDTDWASSFKIGTLYQPQEKFRIGLTYSSQTKYKFSDEALSGQLPLSGTVIAPQQLMSSILYTLSDDLNLLADLGWQDWSAMNNNKVWLGAYEKPATDLIEDTWHLAFGLQKQLSNQIILNTGIAYDSSIYKDQNNSTLGMPSGEAYRLGIGTSYMMDTPNTLGAAFEAAFMDGSSVADSRLAGHYKDSTLYFFAVNYSRKF